MRSHLQILAAVLLMGLAVRPTAGQTALPTDELINPSKFDRKELNRSLEGKRQAERDPSAKSPFTLPEPQVTFETTRAGGRATGTVGWAQAGTEFLLKVSSPIGEQADAVAQPLNLAGLSDGASVTFGVSHAAMFRRSLSVSQVVKLCADAGIEKTECTAGKQETLTPALSRALLKAAFKEHPYQVGAAVSIGRNSFEFVDGRGAAQDPVRETDFAIEGSIGWLLHQRTALLAIHSAYASTYSASKDKTELCRSLADSTLQRCDAVVIGQPRHDRGIVSTIEYRWGYSRKDQAGDPSGFALAFGPRLQFRAGIDGTEDVTSFEVPVYFFQQKQDADASNAPKLNGGISAGWRSDTGFQAYVFIGPAFKLLTR